jgi:hypothetical protein
MLNVLAGDFDVEEVGNYGKGKPLQEAANSM